MKFHLNIFKIHIPTRRDKQRYVCRTHIVVCRGEHQSEDIKLVGVYIYHQDIIRSLFLINIMFNYFNPFWYIQLQKKNCNRFMKPKPKLLLYIKKKFRVKVFAWLHSFVAKLCCKSFWTSLEFELYKSIIKRTENELRCERR